MYPIQRRALTTWITSSAAISLLSVAPGPVQAQRVEAQRSEADKRFVEARALIKADKLEEACASFEESNRIEPRAGTLIYLGACKERLHRLASALAAFRAALDRAKNQDNKEEATKRAAALEPRVSRLTISVAPEARVAGVIISRDGQPVDPADYGRAVPVDGGSHEITASAPGYRPWSTAVQIEWEREKVSVSVPRLVEASPRVEAGSGGSGQPAVSGPIRSGERPASSPASSVVPRERRG